MHLKLKEYENVNKARLLNSGKKHMSFTAFTCEVLVTIVPFIRKNAQAVTAKLLPSRYQIDRVHF
jgi:hypothetical protein